MAGDESRHSTCIRINSGAYATHHDANLCQTSTDTAHRYISVVPCQAMN